MFGWLKVIVGVAAKIYGYVKGSRPTTFANVIPFAVSQLLPAVENAIKYQSLDTKEKFDAWLQTLDQTTGSDPGAVDIIERLPADKEEEFFDHLVEAARIYGYHLIGVPGYRT